MIVAERPVIVPGDWISLGERGQFRAVVCAVYEDTTAGDCEVVFLDDRNRAINDPAKRNGSYWEFLHKRASGGYADNYSRLSHYVAILRSEMEPPSRKRRRR